jgi:hypothetical protein
MKLDPGMHIVMHLVFFGKAGVTVTCILELSLKIPKTVRRTYQIQIQLCVKVSVDAGRRGLGTTWMRLKLDLGCRYALSATIQDTPTRNASKHLTFPLPLLHHLQLVHVDVVPAATTKECSDRTCLCYCVVIIELLMHVIVL